MLKFHCDKLISNYFSWLIENLKSGAEDQAYFGVLCLPLCFQISLSQYFPCCSAHIREALCKHLQASCSTAPFEISRARKAAETWQEGDSGWFSISTASPAEQDVLRGFGDPFVFPVSTCCILHGLSGGKEPSFLVVVTGLFDSGDSQLLIPWL